MTKRNGLHKVRYLCTIKVTNPLLPYKTPDLCLCLRTRTRTSFPSLSSSPSLSLLYGRP